ncbi:DNA repair protein recA 2 like [Actinidia chinensis var. chinensis]|uniref:DNA repair protein recA 2 like n=1 Tax=Actinidia chinensis var. chinensis TaxID=1590841 RepID=A0A2R6RY87_ACTCC|nr:DNA repair protein recA 2 like [Actinidia chinensis var. chinensis]
MVSSFRPLILRSLRFSAFAKTHLSSFHHQSGRREGFTWIRTHGRYMSSAVDIPEFAHDELQDDARAIEKDTALRLAVSRIAGDYCKESMLSLQRFFGSRRLPVISTGSLKLDLALGIGGLPQGRIVEIYGQEASGKTTLALHIIKEAQKLGGYCAYLDVENSLDPSLAESIGVNTENLLISQPDSAENLLCMVDTLTKSGSVDVIVVDSVAALVPQLEIDVVIGGNHKDIQSQIMTQALRKIHYSLCHSQTLIVFVNQVRSKVTSKKDFGRAEEVTCGGNALRFYAAIRMRISRTGLLKTEDKVTGLSICVQVVKNKLAPPMKKAELGIQFGRGICCETEILHLACEHGLILKEGTNFFVEGEVLGNVQEAERYLAENDEVLDKIVKSLRSHLFKRRE